MPRPRTERGPRKIEESRTGRVWWKPGEPHPLDALDEELTTLRDQLPAEIEALLLAAHQTQQHLEALQQIEQADDPTEAFTAADHLAARAVIERFHNRKHEHHLRTIFAIQRRKRLMGRLQAIRAALDLANGLLSEDETLSEEFLTTWREKTVEPMEPEPEPGVELELERTVEPEPEPEPEPAEPEPEPEGTEEIQGVVLSREELRVQHLDEPLTPLVGSVEQSRQLLRAFEAQLPALRSGLVAGNGWIEIFYVPKRHYKKEVIAYGSAWAHHLEHGRPLSPEVEQAIDPRVAACIRQNSPFPKELRDLVYDITRVGPYAKYRWREHKRIYTVSLGLLNDYPEYPFTPAGF
ncbi:hypothetical protein [Dictyobacter arantiisoli]|uniref:Uncharacterized protein n=1 Tax=Dictyobacter arantiisoli TaxID=2014874 RepID=A0A5A5TI34_9CHLR|nr:hypothetical protein [Dictyobacter arantiisoli]GCF10875.1 hypothetical protein KDI_44390 [Dictyobacter arantiisoli]